LKEKDLNRIRHVQQKQTVYPVNINIIKFRADDKIN